MLNFAVHCVTTSLGIGWKHFNHENAMVQSIFRFHYYYQIKRILERLKTPKPKSDGFNRENNSYLKTELKKVMYDYGVPENINHLEFQKSIYHDSHWLDYVGRGQELNERGKIILNDSIRAYVYLLLTAQADAMSNIYSGNSKLDALEAYRQNFDYVVNAPDSIAESVKKFESVLSKASSVINFTVWPECYMIPSNLELRIGDDIVGYNDKIIYSPRNSKPGSFTKPKVKPLPQVVKSHVHVVLSQFVIIVAICNNCRNL